MDNNKLTHEDLMKRLESGEKIYIRRFDSYSRFLHLLVIISFLTLAITGMIIKFSGVGVFQVISDFMGGYEVTGFLHRFAAIITFTYFFLHIFYILKKFFLEKRKFSYMFSGENSMMPNLRDIKEFKETIKWFLGLGPRLRYGRWTYWEKFDYFAVFWGVAVIGFSGLILWFPEFFTALGLPGWVINVATIIHSDEALLATGFIFTVHFLILTFGPDKFPMDPVIFTGVVELEEYIEDRPRQYNNLLETGQLEEKLSPPPKPGLIKTARIFGFTALSLGLGLVVLIIIAMLFLYN